MAQPKMKESATAQLEAPRFEDGKALLIAGLRRVYAPGEMNGIPAQWQSFAPRIGRIAGQIGRATYGVCWQTRNGEGIEYLSGVEVSGFAGVPSDFTVVSLPPTQYAVFPHREQVMKLRDTIDAIFHNWLPASGHAACCNAEAPAFFERYGEEFDPRTGMGGMEVWIPLKS
ncbi:MAG TPA: GyrI-like domain-containing protein [Candidatus Angelobacter sp.]|nr:GyrI-like domain-containing protein [Candidatus Angelobacter sp.]